MPRIPRISGRSRKGVEDAAEPAQDAPGPVAEAPAVAADVPGTPAGAPDTAAEQPTTEVATPDSAPQTPPATAEDAASAPAATTEFPVHGPETPAPPDAPPQALTGAPATAPAPQALTGAPALDPAAESTQAAPAEEQPASEQGSFLDRGRMRRRLRYLRRTRELAFRDLGGLMFDLHRFARSRDDLVHGKLARLTAIDTELRALETALDDRQEVTVLREPGLAACPRCGALHGSDANYCPMCALPVRPGAGLPVASPSPAPPEAPVVEG